MFKIDMKKAREQANKIKDNKKELLIPKGNYTMKLEKVLEKSDTVNGNKQVSLQFRLEDNEKFNNAIVFRNWIFTENTLGSILLDYKALEGKELEDGFDFDSIIGRKVKAYIKHEVLNGKTYEKVCALHSLKLVQQEIKKVEVVGDPIKISENEEFVFKLEDGEYNIYSPFSSIKGVGVKVAENIIKNKQEKGMFKDIEDFQKRLGKKTAYVKKVIEAIEIKQSFDTDIEEYNSYDIEEEYSVGSHYYKNENIEEVELLTKQD